MKFKFISFSKIRENVVYNLTSSAFTSSLGMISAVFYGDYLYLTILAKVYLD